MPEFEDDFSGQFTREMFANKTPSEDCQCPKCGRLHHDLRAGKPPSSISADYATLAAERDKANKELAWWKEKAIYHVSFKASAGEDFGNTEKARNELEAAWRKECGQ